MLKGIQKRMIVVKTVGNRYFDSAYFILKNSSEPFDEGSLLREAKGIVKENLAKRRTPKRSENAWRKQRIFFFFGGLSCGGGVMGLLWLLLSL